MTFKITVDDVGNNGLKQTEKWMNECQLVNQLFLISTPTLCNEWLPKRFPRWHFVSADAIRNTIWCYYHVAYAFAQLLSRRRSSAFFSWYFPFDTTENCYSYDFDTKFVYINWNVRVTVILFLYLSIYFVCSSSLFFFLLNVTYNKWHNIRHCALYFSFLLT